VSVELSWLAIGNAKNADKGDLKMSDKTLVEMMQDIMDLLKTVTSNQ